MAGRDRSYGGPTTTAWGNLHAQIHQWARRTGWLPKNGGLLVGVSGGQDSLCLLKLLVDLQSKWHWSLVVAHCDHRWRADSRENATFVQTLCDRMQLPCEVVRAEEIPTSEAAARQWRYQVFTSLADVHHCQRIVTGHTATDRAETLLYNLMRGSGADGLQALGWSRPVSPQRPDILLIRPLLGVTRQETGAFCQTYDIPTWDDRTNCDRTYARNRIRLDLMPYIAANFNPSVERTLAQTAELLTAEVDYLEHVAAEIYQSAVNLQAGTVQIQRRALGTVHLAIQRRVLRRALQAITAGEITFDHVEKLVALIHAPNRSQSDPFPGGAIAQVRGDWIAIGGSRNGEQPN